MSELQQQTHDIHKRIERNIKTYPQLQQMFGMLSCQHDKCLICEGDCARDISDWPDGALTGAVKRVVYYKLKQSIANNTDGTIWRNLLQRLNDTESLEDSDSATAEAVHGMLDELGCAL